MNRLFLIVSILLTFAQAANDTQELTDQLWVGMKFFPTMVGGDMRLNEKLGQDGKLLLLVVYHNNVTLAETVVNRLSRVADRIGEYPVRFEATNTLDFIEWQSIPIAGIFLAESPSTLQRRQIIQFGITRHLVTFSSFSDDVQNGILTGIHVSSKIRPALNLKTLKSSGIPYNDLIVEIAKTYD
ncbi:conserved exported hypothetical protein [Gammaproteobacteria bacterium]